MMRRLNDEEYESSTERQDSFGSRAPLALPRLHFLVTCYAKHANDADADAEPVALLSCLSKAKVLSMIPLPGLLTWLRGTR